LWNYIHNITIIDFEDKEDNIKHQKLIFTILKNLKMPCYKCQIEYDNEINNIDINLFDKSMYLFEWSWKFHNKINEKINKSLITYENTIDLLISNQNKINWNYISSNKNTIQLLIENQDKINWHNLSCNKNKIEWTFF